MKGEGDEAGATWALRLSLMIRYAIGLGSVKTFRSMPVGSPRGPEGFQSRTDPYAPRLSLTGLRHPKSRP